MNIPFVEDRAELLRWALSGVAVLTLHGAVAATMINLSDDVVAEPTAAMVVDLAPFPMAPPQPESALPPGPEQPDGESSASTPVSEEKEVVEERPDTQQTQEEVQQEVPPVENPEVALAALPPKPQKEVQQEHQQGAEQMAPQPIPEAAPAEIAAAQVQGMPTESRSNVIPRWLSLVSAQIERNKRYPDDAKNDRGIVQISFSIDQQGRVLSSHLVTTSGSSALDREALALIKRAQPFPPPPPGATLSFTVPVKFNTR
jgi:periplasmic protein TonB